MRRLGELQVLFVFLIKGTFVVPLLQCRVSLQVGHGPPSPLPPLMQWVVSPHNCATGYGRFRDIALSASVNLSRTAMDPRSSSDERRRLARPPCRHRVYVSPDVGVTGRMVRSEELIRARLMVRLKDQDRRDIGTGSRGLLVELGNVCSVC